LDITSCDEEPIVAAALTLAAGASTVRKNLLVLSIRRSLARADPGRCTPRVPTMKHTIAVSPERVFVGIALGFGLAFVFITPPNMVPDEPDHFRRTYQLSTGQLIPDRKVITITPSTLQPMSWQQLIPRPESKKEEPTTPTGKKATVEMLRAG